MRQTITFTMTVEDYSAMKDRAARLGESQASFIKRAIADRMHKTGLKRKNNPILPVAEMNNPQNTET